MSTIATGPLATAALLFMEPADLIDEAQPSPRSQRKYICEAVQKLAHSDVTSVFRYLSARLPKNLAFSEHSNGCSINLDSLGNELITQLYIFVLSKETGVDDVAE